MKINAICDDTLNTSKILDFKAIYGAKAELNWNTR